MKIALVQYAPVWEDKTRNKEIINSLLEKTENISCYIFPELTLTGFTMHSKKFAESQEGDSYEYFAGIATSKNADVLAGMIEDYKGNSYNSLLHISAEGRIKAVYRKIHPFTYSTENQHFSAGDSTAITNIKGIKTGLSICYDLRFPELYRLYAKERVELLINIANWPIYRIEHFKALLKARAIENQSYMVGVNRTGDDPKFKYNGNSFVFDPMGKEIAGGKEDVSILLADISPEYVHEVREKLPFLDDIKMI
jgi:omega-amidase